MGILRVSVLETCTNPVLPMANGMNTSLWRIAICGHVKRLCSSQHVLFFFRVSMFCSEVCGPAHVHAYACRDWQGISRDDYPAFELGSFFLRILILFFHLSTSLLGV